MEKYNTTQMQDFLAKLNTQPNPSELKETPDKRALSLPISFIEMTLDELFLGLWKTENFTTKAIVNEVIGEIQLSVFHPIAQTWITRTGAASVVITVDALDEVTKKSMSKRDANLHATDVGNKKPNALDLRYPALKAECIKNAAQSLGKIFGRDINRKHSDTYKPHYLPEITEEQWRLVEEKYLSVKKHIPTHTREAMDLRISERNANFYTKIENYLLNFKLLQNG